jgi:repressor LexA
MNKIKELRKSLNMSQIEFAKSLSVHQTAVSQWENGRTSPDIDIAKKISELYNVSLDYLLDNDTNSTPASILQNTDPTWIPVLGRVAAGIPIEMIADIIDYEQIDEKLSSLGEYFALKIKGNSMEPKISDGDIVIVRKQDDAESGDIVIATVNGDDATCKRLKKYAEGIALLSTNPNYEPMIFTNTDIKQFPIKILGKVVELRAKF